MAEGELRSKSVLKALEILNCFEKKQPWGITELGEALGLYKSNVHTLVRTLAAMDYLQQDKETGKYFLGSAVLRLSRAAGDRYAFRSVALAHMKALAEETGERVYLYVPLKDQIYTLNVAAPTQNQYSRPSAAEGYTCRMHCTGAGKAILAHLPAAQVEDYIAGGLEPYTANTITDPGKLREELGHIRQAGYAMDNMEWEEGIRCVAVPVRDRAGTVLGALSISGPSVFCAGEERIAFLRESLIRCVERIQHSI